MEFSLECIKNTNVYLWAIKCAITLIDLLTFRGVNTTHASTYITRTQSNVNCRGYLPLHAKLIKCFWKCSFGFVPCLYVPQVFVWPLVKEKQLLNTTTTTFGPFCLVSMSITWIMHKLMDKALQFYWIQLYQTYRSYMIVYKAFHQ